MPDGFGNLITRQLVQLFDDRGLKPGDRIPAEIDLASTLAVSRPVVREAMSVLEATGLLVARKGSGRVLLPFSFGSAMSLLARHVTPKGTWLLDLLAVRQALESTMLSLAATKMTRRDFDELEHVTE